jgi:predicted amidohydrolase
MNLNFKKYSIALCQMKVVESKEENLKTADNIITKAIKTYDPDVVVLPEYFNCPPGQNLTKKYAEDEEDSITLKFLSKKAKDNKIYLIGGSIPMKHENKYYNTCYCFDKEGEIKARHRKVHLFDVNIAFKMVYQESNTISAGNEFTVFETEFGKFGIGICYDIRFNEYSQILKKYYGVDFLVYPAAFNTVTGPMHWDLLIRSRALDNNVFLAICSPARNTENDKVYQCYGYSSVVNPSGNIIANAGYEEAIVYSEIDTRFIREIEEEIPTWKQKRNDMYELIKKI